MGLHSKSHTKKEFIEYMEKNSVSTETISRFNELPEKLVSNGDQYIMSIVTSWNDEGETNYQFELNYYSKEKYKFLMEYYVSTNIDSSINTLECKLMNMNLIENALCDK